MQSFPIETHHNKQITKTRSGMTSTNIGRTAAAAVVSVGIFGLVYSHKKGDEEERCASPNVDHPRMWMALAQPAREALMPIHKALCEDTKDPSYPNLSRFGKASYLRRYLTIDVYNELKDKKTKTGVTLEDLIRSGVSLPWGAHPPRGCGIYAGDADSYKIFSKILVPILEDYHHFRMVPRGSNVTNVTPRGRPNPLLRRQVTNLNPNYVLQQQLDPEGQYVLHTRMRVARSLEKFRFSPVISREDRRSLEALFCECVADWQENPEIGGTYLRVMDMTNEQHADLIQRHILFHDPDEYSLSAGMGRDWPDARGVYVNSLEDPSLIVWVNFEDHLRVISTSSGGDLLGVFTQLTKLLSALDMSLRTRGQYYAVHPRLGFLNTSPENLGTALRASVFVKLPRLGRQPGFEDLLDRLRLEVSSRFNAEKSSGIYDIANAERLGQSEVQLINTMINGVGILIGLEKRLERGEKVILSDVK
jgi:creatine kinase